MATKAKPGVAAGDHPGSSGVAIDLVVEAGSWPSERELAAFARRAVDRVLVEIDSRGSVNSELSVVFSDDAHVQVLNARWRGKDKPTNVLSFPAFPDARRGEIPPMLGDVVLAAETVAAEAAAEEMEDLERRILAGLDIPDPYR